MTRRLTSLYTDGLKAHDRVLTLAPVTLLVGANGAGKSEALISLHLLARGRAPGVEATDDGVMRLASGDAVLVRGTFDDGTVMSRGWARDDRGSIRRSGTLCGPDGRSALPSGASLAQALGAIGLALGGSSDVWTPDALLTMPEARLRARLLALVGGLPEPGAELRGLVPAGEAGETPDAWRGRALAYLADRLAKARAAARQAHAAHVAAVEAADDTPAMASIASLQQSLATLRAELADAQALADLRRQLASLPAEGPNVDVEALRAAVDQAATALTAAEDAEAEDPSTDEDWTRLDAAARTLADARRDTDGTADEADVDLAEADVALARSADEGARAPVQNIHAALAEGRARATMLRQPFDSAISHCPDCDCDLAAAFAGLAEAAEGAVADLELMAAEAEAQAAATGVRLRTAREALRRAEWGNAARMLLAEVWPVVERVERGRTLARARRAAQATHQAAVDALTDALRTMREAALAVDLRSRIDAMPPARDPDAIETEIRTVEQLLATAGAVAELKARAISTEGEAADAAHDVEGWVDALAAVRTWEVEALTATRAQLEAPLSASMGAPVAIELVDARGGEACRLTVGGVDVAGLSTGERTRFLGALLVLLAEHTPGWRVVLLDGIETVSLEYREALLAALVAAYRAGRVDQVLVAGCPDTVPEVEGVHVVRLAARAQEVAA
jgi:hypothetical protein